jgi:PAS domain S-box-containing protein
MSDRIHVLHVDDEPDFAELTAMYLEREDDRFAVDTATSAQEGLDRLTDRVDCVISDYDMPGTNGIEFLESVRAEYPDLPFVLFTGKGSEEVASDAISAGVTDYLQKEHGTDQYAVLANRVTNAVAQARTEQRLERQRERFQILFERLTQPVVEVELEGCEPIVQQVNPAFEEVFGYEAAEIVGKSLDAHVVPEGREDQASQINQRAASGESSHSIEVTRLAAEGPREFLLQTASYENDSSGFAIYTDITERKERKRQLERKNARLSALFERFPEPTFAYTYEGGEPYIERVNEAFTETFGYDPEEAVGTPVDSLLVPPDRKEEAEQIDDRVEAGELVDELVRRQTRDGVREFRFRHVSLPEDDSIDGYAIYADVTEQRQREEQLRAEQQRYRTLFEQLPVPLVEARYDEYDPIVTDANPAFEETFGYDASTIVGEPLDEYIVPDEYQDESAGINEHVREGGSPLSREVTRQTADGTREFLFTGPIYRDGSGGVGMYMDISDRKRREEALNELHDATREFMNAKSKKAVADRAVETARTVLDLPINGLWLHDPDGDELRPVSVTSEGEALLGEPVPYAGGESLSWEAFEEGELRVYDDVRTEANRFNPETPIRSELVVPLGDQGVMNIGSTETGDFSEVDISLARILGKSVEAALARADREQRLRAQQERLERQNERLEQFASVVSHDLRNPLRVATGRLDLLREESDSEHVDAIDRALSRIDAIVEDVLWLARQGQDIGEVEPIDLDETVTAAWSIVADTDRGPELVVEEPDGLGRIEADGDRLRQLLENLLRNCVEHGSTSSRTQSDDAVEHGSARTTVTVGRLDDGFYVADDGPGIPPEERDAVFEAGHSTADQGTGFGLSIVQQIVEAHGWEIRITDSTQGGARFEITGVSRVE